MMNSFHVIIQKCRSIYSIHRMLLDTIFKQILIPRTKIKCKISFPFKKWFKVVPQPGLYQIKNRNSSVHARRTFPGSPGCSRGFEFLTFKFHTSECRIVYETISTYIFTSKSLFKDCSKNVLSRKVWKCSIKRKFWQNLGWISAKPAQIFSKSHTAQLRPWPYFIFSLVFLFLEFH